MLGSIAHVLVSGIYVLVWVVLAGVAWVEGDLRSLMRIGGVPENFQSWGEIILTVMFLAAVVRLFGGIIRVVMVVLLLALVAEAATRYDPGPAPNSGHAS
jgi:hypothetical protein